MALLVHLKTVSELRGRSDRIAKVTFRGREAPISKGPQLSSWHSLAGEADGVGQGWEDGWQSSSRHWGHEAFPG